MADKNNAENVGGVALGLKLDDSNLFADVKSAAEKVKAQFAREFQQIGTDTDKKFKQSFSGISSYSKSAADKVKAQFASSAKTAGAEVEKSMKSSFREVSSAGGSMADSLTGGIKKIGAAVVAAFSVQKIKEFGQSAIEQAASVQAQESQLAQTFGSLETTARSAMQDVADVSGILSTRLQGVGTQIYAFAKTSGMDSVNALRLMKDALQVTADSAAYYDRSLEDTAQSLQSFLKGNYANDAALGVSATETTRNAAAMKLYGQSFKDLSEAQKQLTLLQMVKDANALSGAMGQAARESDGWENVIGNLRESWNQLLAAVGKPILQGAIVVVKRLTEWISSLATYAKAASDALGELFGWGSDETDNTATTATNTAQTASAISESVDNQNALTKAVEKTNTEVKRGIAGFDKLNLISKSTASSAADNADNIDSLNNSGTGGNGAIAIETDTAENKIDRLKSKIIAFFETLAENSGFNNFIEEINKGIEKVDFDYIHKNVDTIVSDVQEISQKTAPGIAEMSKSFGTLSGSVAGLAATIGGKAMETLTGGVRQWLEKDKDYIIDTTNEVTGNMSSGFGNLSPIFQDLRDRAAVFLDKIRPFTEGVVSNVLSGVTHVFGEMAKAVSNAFETLTGWIKDFYFFMVDDVAPDTYNSIANLINGIIDMWNGFSRWIFGSIQNIGNAIGEFVKGLGSLFGQDWGFSMPEFGAVQIQQRIETLQSKHGTTHSFATGGIVKAPTLAVVGDNAGAGSGNPEVVSPLNQLKQLMGGGDNAKILEVLNRIYEMLYLSRNQGQQQEISAEIDGNTLFKAIVRQNEIYKDTHRGRSAFA